MSEIKLIDTNRTSGHLHVFRNMRIILLDSLWELLINAQLKSDNAKENQAFKSLRQCKELLDDCLKSVQDSEYDLFNTYRTLIANTVCCKFESTILNKYITSLKDSIGDYVKDQGVFRDMRHKDAVKQTLEAMLMENNGKPKRAPRRARNKTAVNTESQDDEAADNNPNDNSIPARPKRGKRKSADATNVVSPEKASTSNATSKPTK